MAGATALAVVAVLSPFTSGTAFAGTPSLPAGTAAAGTSSPNPASGNSDTTWSFLENNGPTTFTCPQDSAAEGGNFTTFMVPASVDVSQLGFNAGTPVAGPAGTWQANLYSATGSQVKNVPVQAAPGRQAITTTFKFSANGAIPPGTIPPGAYKIGIACINTTDTNPRYPTKFYARTVTLTTDSVNGGTSGFTYQTGAVASPPTAVTATPGNQQCTVSFTGSTSDPANTGYTATATPPTGPAVTATGTASPIVIAGLTNNTSYTITVTATNALGTSAPAAATNPCTPVAGSRTNVSNLTASAPAPGATSVTLSWNPPGANTPPATPVSYSITWTPGAGSASVPFGTNTYTATGLTPASYTFTVTAVYGDNPTNGTPPQSVTVAITPTTVVQQRISVTRPVGALVLTQVCNSNSAVPAETTAQPGFPVGSLPAVPAQNESKVGTPAANTAGSAPTTTATGTTTDPYRPGYPYPTDVNGDSVATYPTWCGLNLANAKFVTKGPGAGQYFATSGVINQISVVDTTNTDSGWTITGQVSNFASATDNFNARQLGWTPQLSDKTQPFMDGQGVLYTPTPVQGGAVSPSSGATLTLGLGAAQQLGHAVPGKGLGISIFDARVKLLIPVTSDSGTYIATLTITTA